ncbi:MAG: hypothetical protein ACI9WU_003707, partial [Myxococcota bacterium]
MQFTGLAATIELSGVMDVARDLAGESRQALGSSHLLLALFTVPNRGQKILTDAHVELDPLIDSIKAIAAEAPE